MRQGAAGKTTAESAPAQAGTFGNVRKGISRQSSSTTAALRGLTVGGAQASEKHAGFVVNVGGATARDMLELMRQIEQRVFEQTGVQLEPEVRILGADEQKKEESV